MGDALSRQLAQWVLSYDQQGLSDHVIARVLDSVLDNLATALAGQSTPASHAARETAAVLFGAGASQIWFTGTCSTPAGAAFCNAMAATSLDLDDGHRGARGHPGSAIIPAVLAVVDSNVHTDRDVCAAIALGYEIAVRVAKAQNQNSVHTHQSGRWAGFGVVAACGRLLRLTPEQLANAYAIAGVWAPNQLANGSSGYARETGNWAKEGIPISVFQAITAVQLAQNGFTGPIDLFDFQTHYKSTELLGRLGEPDAILATYFKRYACCRYIHPALDAWRRQFGSGAVNVDKIARIEVQTFAWALKLSNKVRPGSLVDLQFSLPYCLALLIVHGPDVLLDLNTALLADARASALAENITLTICQDLDARFPSQTLAQLRVHTTSGHTYFSAPAVAPTVLRHEDLVKKLYTIAELKIARSQILSLVRALTPGSVALVKLCGQL